MTDKKLSNELMRMMSEACDARANFYTWKTLNLSKGESKRHYVISNWKYADFFEIVNSGTLVRAFLCLGKIFDKGSDTLRLRSLAQSLNDDLLVRDLDSLEAKYTNVVKNVRYLRCNTIAHNNKYSNDAEVFQNASITPNEIEDLIDDICKILNAAAERMSFINKIPEGSRFEISANNLLDRLSNN